MFKKQVFYTILLTVIFLKGHFMNETNINSNYASCPIEELQRNIIIHVENNITGQLAIEHEKLRMEMKNEIEQLKNDILNLKQEMSEIILKSFSPATKEIGTTLHSKIKPTAASNFDETHNCTNNCGDIEKLPKDCAEAFKEHAITNGIYVLKPLGHDQQPFGAFCKLFNNESWTVIQRRQDGTVDFFRNWQAYKNGFGNLNGEYWLGLDRIHMLTSTQKYKLWIEMKTYEDKVYHAYFDEFSIGNETEGYQLTMGNFSGNFESKYVNFSGEKFTTFDKDNDRNEYNCAKSYIGAWWFGDCGPLNLNGQYKPISLLSGLWWYTGSEDLSLKYVTISIHPA